MLRFILFLCLLLPTVSAAEQGFRQFHAETPTRAPILIQELQQRMPDSVMIAADASEASLSYSGVNTPTALVRLLAATYPALDTAALAPGKPTVISVIVRGSSAGSQLTALINAPFEPTNLDLIWPIESAVLMDSDLPGSCARQAILNHPFDIAATAKTFGEVLQNMGFPPDPGSPQDVSFFIGRSDSCTAILYLQPDPDDDSSTLVVLRILED